MAIHAVDPSMQSPAGIEPTADASARCTSDEEARALAAVLELLIQLESIDDLSAAAATASQVLCEFVQAQRVIVGWTLHGAGACEIIADTAAEHSATDPIRRKIEFALDEIIIRGCLTEIEPEKSGGPEHATLAVHRFALSAAAKHLTGAPLLDADGNARGAWMFIDPAARIDSLSSSHLIDSMSQPLGARLATIQRHQPGRFQQTLQTVSAAFAGNRSAVVTAGLTVLLTAALFPVHYWVRCDSALQPIMRRFVAAPFDGTLEKSFVGPGDLVDEGTLLAKISARELNWEHAGLTADLNRALTERKVSLAKQDYAASQIAQLDTQRLSHRMQLIESRIEHLGIRSPIKGIVVSGDLQEVEGAPLETGQTLFEIAPLGEMIVELMIPEEDFAYVRPEMPVRLRLQAFPTQRIEGVVRRIHPQAEVIENRNVFIAELHIPDPHALYRPGMHGRAKIQSVRRPLAWVLLHKPWSSLLMWLGW